MITFTVHCNSKRKRTVYPTRSHNVSSPESEFAFAFKSRIDPMSGKRMIYDIAPPLYPDKTPFFSLPLAA